jgi:hypothetical protein
MCNKLDFDLLLLHLQISPYFGIRSGVGAIRITWAGALFTSARVGAFPISCMRLKCLAKLLLHNVLMGSHQMVSMAHDSCCDAQA